jgi:hypothetical protein
MEMEIVHRCKDCKQKCAANLEKITRTPSRVVLVHANQSTRESSIDDLDEKLNVWASLAPPISQESSKYPIDLIALEMKNVLTKGQFVLKKPLNIEELEKALEEMEKHSRDNVYNEDVDDYDDDDFDANDDDVGVTINIENDEN